MSEFLKCSVYDCSKRAVRKKQILCEAHHARWRRHGSPLAGKSSVEVQIKFLEESVSNLRHSCVDWPFAQTGDGYGKIFLSGRYYKAHRVALALHTGKPLNTKLCALHAPKVCHNRLCVNPTHLRWGTRAENIADCEIDGTNHSFSLKLTKRQVRQIIADDRSSRKIAKDYGVTMSTIRYTKNKVASGEWKI